MDKRSCQFTILILLACLSGCVSSQSGLLNSNANPAAYHYQMGLSHLGESNYTSALIELTAAEKLDPDNPELLYNLGLAYLGKKRPDLSLPFFKRAIELKPNYSVARNDMGVAFMELKRWDEAIQQFRIVKDDLFHANTESAAINLGLSYLGKGDFAKARAELEAVTSSSPRNPVARLALGRALFGMGKNELAIVEYKKALTPYRDFGAAHYYLGLAQLKSGKKDEARQSFNEVLRIIPDSELGRLAVSYLELLR